MALRFEKGKLRPQPARLKDTRKRTRERTRNQDAAGKFTVGNSAASGRRVKRIIKRYLGSEISDEQTAELTADTLALFHSFKRALGSEVPQVQDTVARRARWGVLSAFYALKAIEIGLLTDAGQAALEMALKLDARCERLDVTCIDLAERLGACEPTRTLSIVERIELAARNGPPASPSASRDPKAEAE